MDVHKLQRERKEGEGECLFEPLTRAELTTDSEASHLRFFLSHWLSQPMLRSRDTANFFCFRTGAFPMGLRLTVTEQRMSRKCESTRQISRSLFSTATTLSDCSAMTSSYSK